MTPVQCQPAQQQPNTATQQPDTTTAPVASTNTTSTGATGALPDISKLTPAQKLEAAGLSVDDLKSLLGLK